MVKTMKVGHLSPKENNLIFSFVRILYHLTVAYVSTPMRRTYTTDCWRVLLLTILVMIVKRQVTSSGGKCTLENIVALLTIKMRIFWKTSTFWNKPDYLLLANTIFSRTFFIMWIKELYLTSERHL